MGFSAYTVWLAPLDRPDTWPLVKNLLMFQLAEVNAILVAIFWLMGVWPMIYACLMFADGRMQNFRVWPYFLGSNFTGVICLLPYLIIRQRHQEFYGTKDKRKVRHSIHWSNIPYILCLINRRKKYLIRLFG